MLNQCDTFQYIWELNKVTPKDPKTKPTQSITKRNSRNQSRCEQQERKANNKKQKHATGRHRKTREQNSQTEKDGLSDGHIM